MSALFVFSLLDIHLFHLNKINCSMQRLSIDCSPSVSRMSYESPCAEVFYLAHPLHLLSDASVDLEGSIEMLPEGSEWT